MSCLGRQVTVGTVLAQLSAPPGCLLSHTLVCLLGVFCLRPILSGCVGSAPHHPQPSLTGCPRLCPGLRLLSLSVGSTASVRCLGSLGHLRQNGQPAYWPGLSGLVLLFPHPQSPSFLGWSPYLRGDTASPEGELGRRPLFPSRK